MRLVSPPRFIIESPRMYLCCLNMRHLSFQMMEKACAQILEHKYSVFYLYSTFMFIRLFYRCYFIGSEGKPVGQEFILFWR